MKNEEQNLSKVILVYGPTGSGKTGLAVELAKKYNGEVISADSRQIYKGMNIGTGKVTLTEMQDIPHFGIDIISPDTVYNAALFRDYAREKVSEISARGHLPIVCGGTGLYIDALLYDIDVPPFESDPIYQAELERFRQEHGNLALWKRLEEVDPNYANELPPNSYPYVMRGLEIMERTGKSKKEFRTTRTLKYEVSAVTPYNGDRATLYEKINSRVASMFASGLIKEVQDLLEKGYQEDCPGLKTIGYAEVVAMFSGEISESRAIELVQQGNRNYAKRQITWCKKYVEFPTL